MRWILIFLFSGLATAAWGEETNSHGSPPLVEAVSPNLPAVIAPGGGAPRPCPTVLPNGGALTNGQTLCSPDGRYELTLGWNGNLVLYRVFDGRRTEQWSTRTTNGARLTMQDDCNLVLYQPSSQNPQWASNTYMQGNGCSAELQNDGNFVVYRRRDGTGEKVATWSSVTGTIPQNLFGFAPPTRPYCEPRTETRSTIEERLPETRWYEEATMRTIEFAERAMLEDPGDNSIAFGGLSAPDPALTPLVNACKAAASSQGRYLDCVMLRVQGFLTEPANLPLLAEYPRFSEAWRRRGPVCRHFTAVMAQALRIGARLYGASYDFSAEPYHITANHGVVKLRYQGATLMLDPYNNNRFVRSGGAQCALLFPYRGHFTPVSNLPPDPCRGMDRARECEMQPRCQWVVPAKAGNFEPYCASR